MSVRPDLEEAASDSTYCNELLGTYCAMCDPDGETIRCENPEGRCVRWGFRCVPVPTMREYLSCRDAYDDELMRRGCDEGPPEDVPECARFVSCPSALRL